MYFIERFFDNKDKSRDDFYIYVKFMIICVLNFWINDWIYFFGFCVVILNFYYIVGGFDVIFFYVDIISVCVFVYIYLNKGILYF